MEAKIDYKHLKKQLVDYIRETFASHYKENTMAVIGLSGGVKSVVMTYLCTFALGKQRVLCVNMPDKGQSNFAAKKICKQLGVNFCTIPINTIITEIETIILQHIPDEGLIPLVYNNIVVRTRMSILYAIAEQYHGKVANTCTKTDAFIGNYTKWGDNVGDFCPFLDLTTSDIIGLGTALGVSKKLLSTPANRNLPYSLPDNEELGFTTTIVDKLLTTNQVGNFQISAKLQYLHQRSQELGFVSQFTKS